MSIFQQGMFTISPNTTPEELAKKRQAISEIMKGKRPRYVGEGLTQLAAGIFDNIAQGKLSDFEAQKQKEAQDQFGSLFGGGSSAYSQPFAAPQSAPQPDYSGGAVTQQSLDPNDPQNIANDTMTALGMPSQSLTKDDIVKGLMQRGLPEHAAQGIAMNFKDESGFDPAAIGDNGNALGLAQWNGPRMASLKQFAAQQGKSATDLNVQMDFLMHELQGPESGAMQAIMSTKTPGEAGAAFLNKFERPAEQHRARREAAYLGGVQPTQASYTQPAQASGGSGFSDAELMQAASNPWLPQQYRAMAQAELDKRQKQSDPLYQLQLQKLQKDLQPQPGYQMITGQQAQQMGLDPSKAYQRGPDGKVSQIGGGGVNVSVGGDNSPGLGKLSPDYGYVLDPATGKPVIDPQTGLPKAAPIPGTPAWNELQTAGKQDQMRQEQTTRAGSIVMQDINRALEQSNGWGTTGFLGGLSDGVGGTPAHDLQATLQTIKGNIGFDRLQQMRDASPTGGALGQVSEQEMATLQAVLGNLDQSQSREQLQRNLKRLQEVYAGIMRKASAYPNADQFGFNAQSEGKTLTYDPSTGEFK